MIGADTLRSHCDPAGTVASARRSRDGGGRNPIDRQATETEALREHEWPCDHVPVELNP